MNGITKYTLGPHQICMGSRRHYYLRDKLSQDAKTTTFRTKSGKVFRDQGNRNIDWVDCLNYVYLCSGDLTLVCKG